MATGIGSFTDALAFGALNDVLSLFHDQNAYGRPNQYEVQILPPGGKLAGHDFRAISLKAESVLMPGRTVNVQPKSADQNGIYYSAVPHFSNVEPKIPECQEL